MIVDYINSSYTFLIIGFLSTVVVFMLLNYMKPRVGLKPEQYKRSEIEMLNLK